MSKPQDSDEILRQGADAPEAAQYTELTWHNVTADTPHQAGSDTGRTAFIGPKRRVGRPRKVVVDQDKPSVGRPPKEPTYGSKDIFKRMGKFVVPGTKASAGPSQPVAPIFHRAPECATSNLGSEGPHVTDPASSDRLPITTIPSPSPNVNAQDNPARVESTPVTIIPEEDSSRPLYNLADNQDDEDPEEDIFDGTGLGEEDDDNDSDDDEDDSEDGADGGQGAARKRKFLRPMPPWLETPFKKHVEESAVRNAAGLPPLYATYQSFFFPKPSTFFLLQGGVKPQDLYSPLFMLWDPEALCKHGIACPNCGRKLSRHSVAPRPRRVVDINSYIWIIGYCYRCRECINPKTKKKGTMTWRSWNPDILSKLPSYIAEEFPAMLSHRSGISKSVFRMLRSSINSGMGPKKFSDALRSQHLLQYDILQMRYLEFLNDGFLSNWMGEKSFSFLPFSDRSPDGFHGYIPSANYLRDVYDDFIETHRQEMNQNMAMRSCRVAAIDHSHKFPKHIAQVNGERVFTGLLTVTNELGEIRMCVLVATKAHSAFEYALILLRESLRAYGHDQPRLFYTDNMSDRNLLESAFPSLREGVTPVEKYSHLPSFSLPTDVHVSVHQTESAIDAALSPIVDDIPDDESLPDLVVGLDTEWNVEMTDFGAFIRGEIAVVQIAYQGRVFILQISDMLSRGRLPNMLVVLLSNPRVLKVGRLVNSDLRQLQDCIKHPRSFPGAVDLAKYAKDRCAVRSAKSSLADLCAHVLGTRLNKNVSERTCSAWERRKLTDDQIRYAACDAYVSLLIYKSLAQIGVPQKLVEPFQPSTPVLLFNADSTNIIARGRLASPDVQPDVFGDIKLRATHILIEVLEVFVPGAIINSHKKRSLESFGAAPFALVALQSRTRSYDPLTTRFPSTTASEPSMIELTAQTASESAADADSAQLADNVDAQDLPDDPSDANTTAGILRQLDRREDEVINRSEDSLPSDRFEVDEESKKEGERLLSSLSRTPWPTAIRSRVLKDVFHVFNMLQLSTTHALRKEFAFVLRDALLIPDNEDRARISQYGATLNPPQTFEQLRASRSAWVWKRCKRVIPPPEELYSLVEQVFSTYGPLQDEQTKKPLFSPHNWRAAIQILELVRNGSISDPPNEPLYVVIGIDAKCGGLPIYRCFRGTNSTEGGVHTHLRGNLPSSGASFRHTDSCLADFVLHKNLSVGTFNSTGQHFSSHAYIWVTNRLQELLISLEDRLINPRHITGWVNGNLYVQTKESIGIISVPPELQQQSGMAAYNKNVDAKQRHAYLAQKQNTRKAILPVHTPAEHKLFSHLMREDSAFASRLSGPRWMECVRVWNTHADKDKEVFYKLSEQLSAYYKTFLARLNVKHTKLVTLQARKAVDTAVNLPSRVQQAPPVPSLTLDDSPGIPSSGFVLDASRTSPTVHASITDVAQPRSQDALEQALNVSPDQPIEIADHANPRRQHPPSVPPNSDRQTRDAVEQLSRQRVAESVLSRTASTKQRKPPSCRRCGRSDCKGKRGNLDDCDNPCQDCGKIKECRGRNVKSNPNRPCHLAWPV